MKSNQPTPAPVLAYPLDQVAEMLSVSRDTLDDMLALGEIGYIHVGKRKRILVEELRAYFRRRKVFEAKQILAQAGSEHRLPRCGCRDIAGEADPRAGRL